jgi:CMP-N,N'-diacetyllegionaminic acid synthase
MINKKKILAIVPARMGSKRIKKKNFVEVFEGLTLLDFTYRSIIGSKYIDNAILSSDSKKILDLGKKIGFNHVALRPKNLSKDLTPSELVVNHVLTNTKKKFDIIILLQPTSPLRNSKDIDNALKKFIKKKYLALISVSKSKKKNKFNVYLNKSNLIKKNFKFKKKNNFYFLNGAIYIADCKYFKKNKSFYSPLTGSYSMPYNRSLDIDTYYDLEILKKKLKVTSQIKN